MSDGTLLVLGASRYQLDVIERAKALGYRVVTTDNVPANPGHSLADAAFGVDTTDVAGVLDVARRVGANGVIAPCTDVAVTTAAEVARALGLPGVPVESAAILTSKIRFRAFLAEAGLPRPSWRVLEDVGDVGDFDAPAIVKPEGSSGSKGVFIVRSRAELSARLHETLGFSPRGRAILEGFIEGHQGTCEGVIENGELRLCVVTDRDTAEPPFVVTRGHRVPTRLADVDRAKVRSAVLDVLRRLDVRTSTFDADFVLDGRGVVHLLELTPRLGGNALTTLVTEAADVDLAAVAIRIACGAPSGIADVRAERPVAQLVLGVHRRGRLTYDEAEAARLSALPWVRKLALDVPVGTPVEAFINGRTRVGEVTIMAASREELDARVAEVRARLRLDARP